ncbi:MAG: DUF1846 domain-containing protein [Clostridia bacterium]|nr:DUF1846 domain-containing protein [Clostridia bacterium]
MVRTGFSNEKYISMQSEQIGNRIAQFGGKLYLEFGGKLFDDYHASRVLPGFKPDSKVQMLLKMKDQAEIVIVINAGDIENSKIRGDIGISYDADVLRLIDAFREIGLYVGSVVISQFSGQKSAVNFKNRLEQLNMPVFIHYPIEGYPHNVSHIVSPDGLGKNDYIVTSRPLVVVTAPGPGSGKMATCLSQLYHDSIRGIRSGYAKFETFPIWNLPVKHPVNLAYEAATVDLNDIVMIDPFHLEAYGRSAVNYSRDVEIFPVLNAIFERIGGTSPYKSPTDMGVNMAGYCLTDDEACQRASKDEIIRRYFKTMCDVKCGKLKPACVSKIESLMSQAGVGVEDRPVVRAALERSEALEGQPAVALELPDGTIVTGKNSALLGAASAVLLNAVKALAGFSKILKMIQPEVIEPIQRLKIDVLGNHNPRLHSNETLIALAMSAALDLNAAQAVGLLNQLRGCEAHSTIILPQVDEDVFRKLGINLTCEPKYYTKKLFHR